jgi:hypothetical protein
MSVVLTKNRVEAILAKARVASTRTVDTILGGQCKPTIDPAALATRISNLLTAAAPTGNRNAAGPHKHSFDVDPPGPALGKIKHAVLIIGGKRYRGPSHFQALMTWGKENANSKGLPNVPESNQGFETESGHFLNRDDAADYALRHKLVRKEEVAEAESTGRLQSEQLHLQAVNGKLYTEDAVMAAQAKATATKADAELADRVRLEAGEQYRQAALKAVARRKRDERDDIAAALLLLLSDAGERAYATSYTTLAQAQKVPPLSAQGIQTAAKEFAAGRQAILTNFAKSFTDQLTDLRQQLEAEGKTPQQVASSLRKTAKAASTTMVSTEAQATYGAAQLRLLQQAGFKTKVWQTCEDDRVRPTHVECGDQGAIPLDKPFSNGLMYPGDPNGGAEEVCNCRCNLIGGSR